MQRRNTKLVAIDAIQYSTEGSQFDEKKLLR